MQIPIKELYNDIVEYIGGTDEGAKILDTVEKSVKEMDDEDGEKKMNGRAAILILDAVSACALDVFIVELKKLDDKYLSGQKKYDA